MLSLQHRGFSSDNFYTLFENEKNTSFAHQATIKKWRGLNIHFQRHMHKKKEFLFLGCQQHVRRMNQSPANWLSLKKAALQVNTEPIPKSTFSPESACKVKNSVISHACLWLTYKTEQYSRELWPNYQIADQIQSY